MAKWREKTGNATKEKHAAPNADRGPGTRRLRSAAGSARSGVRSVTDAIARLVTIIAMVICLVLALHIAFSVFNANPGNSIVNAVNDWADWFAWRFRDIFVPKDGRVGVLVNYGIAAVVYLIVGRVVAGLIRRIG